MSDYMNDSEYCDRIVERCNDDFSRELIRVKLKLRSLVANTAIWINRNGGTYNCPDSHINALIFISKCIDVILCDTDILHQTVITHNHPTAECQDTLIRAYAGRNIRHCATCGKKVRGGNDGTGLDPNYLP